MITEHIQTAAYLFASILFILSLGGLSSQESAKRGVIYGIVGMVIAILATVLGGEVHGITYIIIAIAIASVIGVIVARKVEMTAMPQLVAILHSFVGLAAVLVGFGSYIDPHSQALEGVEKTYIWSKFLRACSSVQLLLQVQSSPGENSTAKS